MTKFQYFQKNELSAYKIAAASYIELSMTKALLDQLLMLGDNLHKGVNKETTKILEEWYDDYLLERI